MTQEEQIRLYRLMEKLNWFSTRRCTISTGILRNRPRGSVIRRSGSLHMIFCGMTCPKRCRINLIRINPNDFALAQEVELQCP